MAGCARRGSYDTTPKTLFYFMVPVDDRRRPLESPIELARDYARIPAYRGCTPMHIDCVSSGGTSKWQACMYRAALASIGRADAPQSR